ncbi:hypothetical protein BRADI_5g02885v3 [Brachypodium distachyon]|uniref:Reverse transcriptase zinc-binding domain-containing protein n=1 Tax=Brachypodium distachyon TaxID=15368 RepID=A0A2K2CF43_BRADI|nr:hypothetical protein BRADI_5g02885v3 [Brachypodium distachyon]
MVVGNGSSTLFWEDRWMDGRAISKLAPALYQLISKRTCKSRNVNEALADQRWIRDIRGALGPVALWQYIQIRNLVRDVLLTDAADVLQIWI